MKIEVINKGNFHFEAKNEGGKTVDIDASPAIGGENKGARPMELLIMGLGGCSGIDVVNILKKQRIDVKDFSMSIDAEREPDAVPSLFRKVHITFSFNKDIDHGKAERAVALSLEKYCSVAKTLESTATITYNVKFE